MFKLNIECSEDFTELHIKFKNGQSAVVSSSKQQTNETYLDTEDNTSSEVSQNIIQKPIIEDKKGINVASELQNLDI